MEPLYHKTNLMLEEVNRYFMKLEKCQPNDYHQIESEIQIRLDQVMSSCEKLDIMANKEPPHRRTTARVQVDQIKYDCRHYEASLRNVQHRRQAREQEMRDREELLSKTFSANDRDTSILIDQALQQHTSLQNAHRSVDELIGSGVGVLENLRDQRTTLKGAHKKILDIANTLGLSNTVMRLIEKRTYQDKFVLFIGMIVTCSIMFLVVKYLA